MTAWKNVKKNVGKIVCTVALLFCVSRLDAAPPARSAQPSPKNKVFQLSSTAFKDGEYVPEKHTGDGSDVSPPLEWTDPPGGTKCFALVCDDPDAPAGTWVHWVAWGIKPDVRELPEGVPRQHEAAGIKHGLNDFRKTGYNGPAPPPGKDHRYFFRLYALDTELDVKPNAGKKDLLEAIEGHILAETSLTGRYVR